jgi:hypothetical protein
MEARGVSLHRSMRPDEIRCPAGSLVNDADCMCAIEGALIEGRRNPQTVEGFCAGSYEACSTWLAAKKIEEKGGDLRRIIASQQSEMSRRRNQQALRDARLRRAQHLMLDPGPEGKAFRKALKVGEFEHLSRVVEG